MKIIMLRNQTRINGLKKKNGIEDELKCYKTILVRKLRRKKRLGLQRRISRRKRKCWLNGKFKQGRNAKKILDTVTILTLMRCMISWELLSAHLKMTLHRKE
jgi:hypothetical protein